jgi:molecular chaperone GrpE (heat shock protein)
MNTEEYQAPQPNDDSSAQPISQEAIPESIEKEDNLPVSRVEKLSETPILDCYETNFQQLHQNTIDELEKAIIQLKQQKQELTSEIATLQASSKNLKNELDQSHIAMGKVMQEALSQFEQRKQSLEIAVEQLEKRQERVRNEMKTSFAGVSQDLAIRVQGFKDYLTGSLQDLAAAAEQLQLLPQIPAEIVKHTVKARKSRESQSEILQFAPAQFEETAKTIHHLIGQYRNQPDYYGPPWQLRRTFGTVHAELASYWFFQNGGRGTLKTTGNQLQNILIASAIISVLYQLYGNRLRPLVLTNSPERLGDWRRGLQDCLGIDRQDFGPDRGLALFERSEAVVQKAEKLQKARQIPLIIIDDSEGQVSLSLLQFSLWLAFSADIKVMRNFHD